MSTDYNVYIGPYIELKTKHRITHPEYPTCKKKKCSKYLKSFSDSSKFCDKCGSELVIKTKSKKEKVDFWSFCDQYENPDGMMDAFYSPEYMDPAIIIPCDFGESIDPVHEGGVLELMNATPEADIAKLKNEHEDAIAKMEDYFGKTNLTFKWGVVSYTS